MRAIHLAGHFAPVVAQNTPASWQHPHDDRFDWSVAALYHIDAKFSNQI